MSFEILDGKGRGFRAGVSRDNLLEVSAFTTTAEAFAVRQGRAYFANISDQSRTLTTTATGGVMLVLKNLGPTRIVIQKVFASAAAAGGVVAFIQNLDIGTLANFLTHSPRNLNFSVATAANAEAYTWNEVGDGIGGLSNGNILSTYILGVGHNVLPPLDGSLILGPNDNLAVEYTGVATEFTCNVRFTQEEIE